MLDIKISKNHKYSYSCFVKIEDKALSIDILHGQIVNVLTVNSK